MTAEARIKILVQEALNADRWITSEAQMQEATAKLLDGLGLLWTHPANERKCSPRRGAALKRQGVKPGVPDVLIFTPCRVVSDDGSEGWYFSGCAIELKYGKNKVTASQSRWLCELMNAQWKVEVARGISGVVDILRICGYIPREKEE